MIGLYIYFNYICPKVPDLVIQYVALKSETYTLAVVVFTLYNALPLCDIKLL